MQFFNIFIVLILLLGSFKVFGATSGRTMYVSPFSITTVAGGIMNNGTSAISCITADIIAEADSTLNGGVSQIGQYFEISFQNISTVSQTIKISYDISITSSNSDGYEHGITHGDHSHSHNIPHPGTTFTLDGESSTTYTINILCSSTTCAVKDSTNINVYNTYAVDPACGNPQVCLSANTQFSKIKIEIAEDKGAVIANLSSRAHRNCGYKDHYLSPPPSIAINGGRPF